MKEFRFKKEFGQNFIFDEKFLVDCVEKMQIPDESTIVEIGAGMGSLTKVLAKRFAKVVSYEIDKTLTEKLRDVEYQFDNLEVRMKDILREDIEKVTDEIGEFFLVANLPYYITSKIIFSFLLKAKKIKGMFVMVQKEVGERFCAESGRKEYGVPSVVLDAFGKAKILRQVNRNMFMPVPNVDSCIIEIDVEKNKFGIEEKIEEFEKFVTDCFKMRRKTLFNNLLDFLGKEKVREVFEKFGFEENVRAESLTTKQFVDMFLFLQK